VGSSLLIPWARARHDLSAPACRSIGPSAPYRGHRFPAPIIQHAIWLYLRFTLSYRDVEELLAERGLDLSYETIRRWVTFPQKSGHRIMRLWPLPAVG
jgi:transposase-like protein